MERKEEKPSEVIVNFLDWLKQCQTDYEASKAIVNEEDMKQQDFWHMLEFEEKSEARSKTATIIHKSRVRRREAKNQVELLEKVVQFSRNERSKQFFQTLKTLVRDQRIEEERLSGKRTYNPRTSVWNTLCEEKRGDGS